MGNILLFKSTTILVLYFTVLMTLPPLIQLTLSDYIRLCRSGFAAYFTRHVRFAAQFTHRWILLQLSFIKIIKVILRVAKAFSFAKTSLTGTFLSKARNGPDIFLVKIHNTVSMMY